MQLFYETLPWIKYFYLPPMKNELLPKRDDRLLKGLVEKLIQ